MLLAAFINMSQYDGMIKIESRGVGLGGGGELRTSMPKRMSIFKHLEFSLVRSELTKMKLV